MNNPVDIKFTASQEPSCNIDFVSFSKDSCTFEGSVTGCSIPGEPLVYLKCGAGEYPCAHFQKKAAPFELSENEISFKGSIPLIPGHSLKDISIVLKSNGGEVFPLQVTIGKFVPLFAPFPQSACYYGPWKLSFKSPAFSIQWEPVVSSSRFNTFLRGMFGLLRMRAFKTVVFKTFYHIAKPFVRKQIWLISDRVTKAGDNGEALFRYLCALRPKDIHPVFVISKSSSDFKALRKTGSVVAYLSIRHKLLHLLSKCVISSAGYSPMNCPVTPLLKDIAAKPFVFLQHGITNNDISAWVNRYSQNISGFVTAAKPEHASIIENPAYHYRDDQVWLTGFPRFDLLKNNSQRKITIMPTWRMALMKAYNSKAGVWQIANEFKDSDYVRFFPGS